MSYTSEEQVRGHFAEQYPALDRVTDQRLRLDGDDYRCFYGGAVEPSSLVVMSLRTNDTVRKNITLTAEGAGVDASRLVAGSVVVASDSSLGTLYTENRDYTVDYADGRILIKSGSLLSVGQMVTVWYVPYTVYQSGVDYRLQADLGELARIASGDIADGETVILNYQPVVVTFGDTTIAAAVRDANGLVEREVDPGREFGAEPSLVTAATYRALEIVCRDAAARELASLRGQDRVAAGWMKLAEAYGALADRLLKSFRPPFVGPASPTRS